MMILAGDIGGTKTQLALFETGPGRPRPVGSRRMATADHPSMEAMIEDFLHGREEPLRAACLAVAGPVADGRSRLTNLPWTIAADDLARRFGWEGCLLLNDLEATAHALPLLEAEELETLRPVPAADDGNVALLAPGTGLGAALALRRGGEVQPLASEAGHADFAPVDEETLSLWRYIFARRGRATQESVLSGPGLGRIYRWRLQLGDAHPDPRTGEAIATAGDPFAEISRLALEGGDPVCKKSMEVFLRCLGAAAGNLALTATTRGGLYLAGGIAPKILPELRRGGFEAAFLNKGRFRALLETVPVHVVLAESAPLLGAAHAGLAALRALG